MKRNRIPYARFPAHRRGMLTAWSALALVAVGLCGMMAINRGLISHARSKSQHCADAVALAACRSLLTDDLLRSSHDFFSVPNWRVERSRDKALKVAERHRNLRNIPTLDRDDIHVHQRLWNSEQGRYLPMTDSAFPNAVRVRITNRNKRDWSARLIGAGLSGIGRAEIDCAATACMHDQICGYEASRGLAIPLAPLAIPYVEGQAAAGTWGVTDDHLSSDLYSWDEVSRQVLEQPDDLCELSLTIRKGAVPPVPGQLTPVELCSSLHDRPISDRTAHGLQHRDTTAADWKQLTFPRADRAWDLTSEDLDSLESVLHDLVGQKRLFPLANLAVAGPHVELAEVVAARVLVVHRSDDDEIRVVLQPTVISTAAAVVCNDPNYPSNRYVRRISLLR